MKEPTAGAGSVSQRWGYTGLASNGPYYDNRYSPPRYYPSGFHAGVDIAAARGTRIRNMEHGIVVAASWNGCEPNGSCWGYGGGYVVIVKHNSIPVYSSHAHMQRLYVKAGQPVHRGQVLGELDTMGYATGPHDHVGLWVRGLWWTVNRAYTLDPWSAMYGPLRDAAILRPAACRVPLNVRLRSGPGLNYPIVATGRTRTTLPMFKRVTGGAVPGYLSRTWVLVWHGRWCYAFAPLTDVIRTAEPTDNELAAAGGVALDDVGMGAAIHDRDLTEYAPSAEDVFVANPEPDGGVAFRSSSSVAHLADAEDAF